MRFTVRQLIWAGTIAFALLLAYGVKTCVEVREALSKREAACDAKGGKFVEVGTYAYECQFKLFEHFIKVVL